jgi:hypothetical protein
MSRKTGGKMNSLYNKTKEFFIENRTIIKKFWINQFASSLLGIMVTWPFTNYSNNHPEIGILPELIAFLFCGGFFCYLIYDVMYEIGAKDYVRVHHQNAVYEPNKALKIIMFAYIPTIILTLLGVIFFVVGYGNGFAIVSFTLNIVIHAMYMGLFAILPVNLNVIAFPVSILITTLAGCLAYYLSTHDKTLRGILGIKVKVKEKK